MLPLRLEANRNARRRRNHEPFNLIGDKIQAVAASGLLPPPETVLETEHAVRRAVAVRFDRSITCVFRQQPSPSVRTIDKSMADGHGFRVPRPPTAPRGTGTTPTNSPSDTRPRRGRGRSGGRRSPGAVTQSAQSAASVSAPGALTILSMISSPGSSLEYLSIHRNT